MNMDKPPAADLDDLIDGAKIGAPAIAFLVIATMVLLSDGFDLSAIGYAGPELVKEWHVLPADLVPVFSAGIFGLLVGGPLFGFLGDRYGRRRAVLAGLCLFGSLTLLTAAASSLPQLVALRFLTGIGLGGVIPNIGALAAEIAPRRLRGRFISIVGFGVPLGIACPGWVAASLVPAHGWQVLMLAGGLLPLAVAVLGFFMLPESVRYLAGRGGRTGEVQRIAQAMRPDLAPAEVARAALKRRPAVAAGSPGALFAGGLAAVTPLLWVTLAANQMTNFFLITWLPTLLQSAGSSTSQAGMSASLFSVGGLCGGMMMALFVDRLGVLPIVILLGVGTPLIASIGLPGLSPLEHGLVIAAAGFCVTGTNFGMNATLGMIYPTPVRSMGAGWAQAAGRVGAITAPLAGGALLAMHLPLQDLLVAPAFVLGVGALASGLLAVLCIRRFGGCRISEFPVARPPAPAVQVRV